MALRPHDRSDLFLAPVALEVDARLSELGEMSMDELNMRVALAANVDTRFPAERERGLLTTVTHLIEMHDWQAAWDTRGLRLSHADHGLTLGCPPNFAAFLDPEYTPSA